jgi:hypothetical protein
MHQGQNRIERLLLSFSINENKIMYNIYKHTMSAPDMSEPNTCIINSKKVLNELKTIGDAAQRLNKEITLALEQGAGDASESNVAESSNAKDNLVSVVVDAGAGDASESKQSVATAGINVDESSNANDNSVAGAGAGINVAESSNTKSDDQSVDVEPAAETRDISDDTAIDVDGQRYIYGNIMRAFENMKNGKTKNINNLSTEKLDEVYNKLKNAKTTVEVQNILREHNFEIGGKNPTNRFVKRVVGGTRKPRMHKRNKTQRKRSKTIRKKKNRK